MYAKEDTIEEYIDKVFGEYAVAAKKIANCESKMNSDAVGDGGKSIGLFQIHTGYHLVAPRFLKDFRINTLIAYKLFSDSGKKWTLWSCQRVLKYD